MPTLHSDDWRDSRYLTERQSYRTCQPPRFAFALWVVRRLSVTALGALTGVAGVALMALAFSGTSASQGNETGGVLGVGLSLIGLGMIAGGVADLICGVTKRVRREDPLFSEQAI